MSYSSRLMQVVVTAAANTSYVTNLNGRFRIKLVGINYFQSDTTNRLCFLNTPNYRVNYSQNGTYGFLTLSSNEHLNLPWVEGNFDNKMSLSLVDSSNVVIQGFTNAVLTFEVEPVEN